MKTNFPAVNVERGEGPVHPSSSTSNRADLLSGVPDGVPKKKDNQGSFLFEFFSDSYGRQ